MAAQICPSCKAWEFDWFIEDEASSKTTWNCNKCGYTASEKESLQRICKKCNTNAECRLKDKDREFWYCFYCSLKEENKILH